MFPSGPTVRPSMALGIPGAALGRAARTPTWPRFQACAGSEAAKAPRATPIAAATIRNNAISLLPKLRRHSRNRGQPAAYNAMGIMMLQTLVLRAFRPNAPAWLPFEELAPTDDLASKIPPRAAAHLPLAP